MTQKKTHLVGNNPQTWKKKGAHVWGTPRILQASLTNRDNREKNSKAHGNMSLSQNGTRMNTNNRIGQRGIQFQEMTCEHENFFAQLTKQVPVSLMVNPPKKVPYKYFNFPRRRIVKTRSYRTRFNTLGGKKKNIAKSTQLKGGRKRPLRKKHTSDFWGRVGTPRGQRLNKSADQTEWEGRSTPFSAESHLSSSVPRRFHQ